MYLLFAGCRNSYYVQDQGILWVNQSDIFESIAQSYGYESRLSFSLISELTLLKTNLPLVPSHTME